MKLKSGQPIFGPPCDDEDRPVEDVDEFVFVVGNAEFHYFAK